MALPKRGSAHPITAHYSFIHLKRMKGWVGLVGWHCRRWFTHISGHPSHQLQVERGTGKVRWSQTHVLPLCHITN